MNKTPNRLLPVIYSAIAMTLINVVCCAGIIAGGFLGVFIYNRELTGTNIPLANKDGVMIGILSGIMAAILSSGFYLVITLFSNINPIPEISALMGGLFDQMPIEFSNMMNQLSNEYNQYGFSPTLTIVTLASNLVMFPLFGAIGALIGVSVFKNKRSDLE